MITVKGQLVFGAEHDGGTHKEFEMRAATVGDAITAIEKSGNTQSGLRLRVYKAAEQICFLGTMPAELITGELLLSLPEEDVEPILAAQDAVEKKQKSSKSK